MTNVIPLRSEPPEITSLSFVHDYWVREPGKRRGHWFRVFWNVRPSGDYSADCAMGCRLAREYLKFARAARAFGTAGANQIGLIAHDMSHQYDGITVGFWSVVGYAAACGAEWGENIAHRWEESCKRREAQS